MWTESLQSLSKLWKGCKLLSHKKSMQAEFKKKKKNWFHRLGLLHSVSDDATDPFLGIISSSISVPGGGMYFATQFWNTESLLSVTFYWCLSNNNPHKAGDTGCAKCVFSPMPVAPCTLSRNWALYTSHLSHWLLLLLVLSSAFSCQSVFGHRGRPLVPACLSRWHWRCLLGLTHDIAQR